MSAGEGGRSRNAKHVLLEMAPNADGVVSLIRASSVLESHLPFTLQESAPPRRSDGTCGAGTNATDFFPGTVVSTGVALHSNTSVEEVVLSWPKNQAAHAVDVAAAFGCGYRRCCCCHGGVCYG